MALGGKKNVIEFVLKAKDQASAKVKGLGGGISGLGSKLGSLAAGPAGMAAGAVAAIGVAALAATQKVAKWGDELAKTSKRVGVSVENLSTLSFAAERSGANFKSLTTGLRTLARNSVEAADGTAEYAESFEKLGVQVTDSEGNMRSMEDLLLDSADAFAGMTNDTEAAALAQDIFGRSGLELLPMLKEGSAGIAELQNRAKDLGIQMSGESAAASEKYIDAQTDLKEAFKGISMMVGQALMPVLTHLINWFVDGIVWTRRFLEAIANLFRQFPRLAGNAISFVMRLWRNYYDIALAAIQGVGGAIDWIGKKTGIWHTNLAGDMEGIRATYKEKTDAIIKSIDSWGEKQDKAVEEKIGPALDEAALRAEAAAQRTQSAAEQAGSAVDDLADSAEDAGGAFEEMGPPVELAGRTVEDLGEEADDAAPKVGDLSDEVDGLGESGHAASLGLGDLLGGIDKLAGTDLSGKLGKATGWLKKLGSIPGVNKIPGVGKLTSLAGGSSLGAGTAASAIGSAASTAASAIGSAASAAGSFLGGTLAPAALALAPFAGVGYLASLAFGGHGPEESIYTIQEKKAQAIAERQAASMSQSHSGNFGARPQQMSAQEMARVYGYEPSTNVTINAGGFVGTRSDAEKYAEDLTRRQAENARRVYE